jgi:hypothetical protein
MAATATARAVLNAAWSAEEAAGLPSAALMNRQSSQD